MQLFRGKKRRQKFSHRVRFWNKISGYRQRAVIESGRHLDTVKYIIPSVAMAGSKIAFFSDLHWPGRGRKLEFILNEMAAAIKLHQPDFQIFCGDIISYACDIVPAAAAMRVLPDIGIKLACPGTWDRAKMWLSVEDWKRYYAAAGYKLLISENFVSDKVIFYGCDDVKTGQIERVNGSLFPLSSLDWNNISADRNNNQFATLMDLSAPLRKYHILLSHSPDSAVKLCNIGKLRDTDLILTGHTHGGQVRLPFIGAIKTSSRYRRKFDYGHYLHQKTGTHLLVTSGLGTSLLPIRWNCRPELVIVEFVSSSTA
jgi:predicted MPP superfamily phosphohydrolase